MTSKMKSLITNLSAVWVLFVPFAAFGQGSDGLKFYGEASSGKTSHGVSIEASISDLVTPYTVTLEDEMILSQGETVTHVWRDKSRTDSALDVFGAIDIKASPAIIWAIMTDCSRGSEIVKGMLSCDVLETAPDKQSDIRQQIFDMGPFLPNAKTRFRSDYRPYESIAIRRVGGDLKIQNAIWQITPRQGGLTRVTYRATILLKFPVPRGIVKNATRKDTPQIMRNLKSVAQMDDLKQQVQLRAAEVSQAAEDKVP